MAYSKDFKEKLGQIQSDAASALMAINSYKEKIETLYNGSDDEAQKIKTILEHIEKQKETFESEIQSILDVLEENPELAEDAQNLQANIESITDISNKIQVIYKQIYGFDTKNEAGEVKHQEGIKDKLEKSYNDLITKISNLEKSSETKYNSYLTNWNKSFESLKKNIEDLLPGATSAGLASAYESKKEQEEKSLKWGFRWFVGIVLLMIIIGFSLFIPEYAPEKDDYIGFISRLVLFAPLIWIGIYQNKRINISKKIIEEYAHKASIMKTFDGLLKQLFQTNKNGKYISSDKVRETLLLQTLNAVSRNPADCISDCNKSDNPMIDIFKLALKKSKNGISADSINAIFNGINQTAGCVLPVAPSNKDSSQKPDDNQS